MVVGGANRSGTDVRQYVFPGSFLIPVIHLLVQHLDDEGVVEQFVADRRLGTVAGIDVHLLAQRNQGVEDRAHDPRIVAGRSTRGKACRP